MTDVSDGIEVYKLVENLASTSFTGLGTLYPSGFIHGYRIRGCFHLPTFDLSSVSTESNHMLGVMENFSVRFKSSELAQSRLDLSPIPPHGGGLIGIR